MRGATRCLALWVLLVAAHLWPDIAAADVVGCGGFVQASSAITQSRQASDPKIDFSTFSVEVQNKEGLVKERVNCAPNGYFFLPVYDQGHYFLQVKGPDGWGFEPEKVSVVVDEKVCNGGKDTNFQITGFSVSGRVLGSRGVGPACESGAPQGVELSLKSPSLKEPLVAATRADGTYHFLNVLPGSYEVVASHPKWRIETLLVPKVDVAWGSVQAPEFFRVAGYDLTGSVVAQGKPVPGVAVYLYSSRLKKLITCPLGPGGPSPLPGRKPLCHAVTDNAGVFSFPEVFCGEYQLAAQFSGEFATFEVAPELITVSVSHNSAVAPEPFNVLGFSIGGLVVDSVGAGVADAQVFLDGAPVATTDAKGYYKLGKMVAGKYSLAAKKDHYYFADLSKIDVGPASGALPPITAQAYDVCAKVTLDSDTSFDRKRTVSLTPAQLSEGEKTVAAQANFVDETGTVCFKAAPGKFELQPQVSAVEVDAGLLFEPKHIDVNVVARPLTLNAFQQTHLSIAGFIDCIEVCDERLNITLTYLRPLPSKKSTGKLPPADRSVSVEPGTSTFRFERVEPGWYRLAVKEETREVEVTKTGRTLDADEYCWENDKSSLEVVVQEEDVEGLSFKQSGYRLVVNTTVEDIADLIGPEGEVYKFTLKPGRNEFCMDKPGGYQAFFMHGCYFYGFFVLEWTTVVPYLVTLDPEFYALQGWAYVDSRHFKWANNITDYAHALVYDVDGTRRRESQYLTPEHEANASQPVTHFEIKFFFSAGEEAFIEPFHNGGLNPMYKTKEMYKIEQEEEAEKERQKFRKILREEGFSEKSIDDLEEQKAAKEAAGEEVVSVLQLLGSEGERIWAKVQRRELEEAEKAKREQSDDGEDGEAAAKVPFLEKGAVLKADKGGEGAATEEEGGGEESAGAAAGEEGEEGEEGKEEEAGSGSAPAESEAPEGDVEASFSEEEVVEEVDDDEDESDEPTPEEAYTPEEKPFPPPTRILFYPRRRHFKIPRHSCPPELGSFVGRPGVYLNGTITPPVSGVNVSVIADSDSPSSGWKAGETVEWGLSHDGVYIVGPLYDDTTYHVELHKEGFVFRALNSSAFEAQQLASISVIISGAPTSRPKGDPDSAASSVLLSLSGDGGFVRNTAVAPGHNHSFMGLFPGTFFLRPLLKEYEFTPAAREIELQSGEQLTVDFTARRVAYSVSGRVLSLLGKAEEGVTLEARSKEGSSTNHYETAVTNKKGKYKLRGLIPGVEYSIQVLIKGQTAQGADSEEAPPLPRFERASPKSRTLVLGTEDVEDMDFIAFDHAPSLLSGTVRGPDVATWRRHIRVEVVHHSDRAKVVQSAPLPISRFFEFKDLPQGKYVVRLALDLPEKTHGFSADEVEADLRTERVLHVGNLRFNAWQRQGTEAQACSAGADGTKQCKW